MDKPSDVQALIKKAKSNASIQGQFVEYQLDKWGESHTPLDVDLKKVIQVAKQAGDTNTEQDLIHAQYVELD